MDSSLFDRITRVARNHPKTVKCLVLGTVLDREAVGTAIAFFLVPGEEDQQRSELASKQGPSVAPAAACMRRNPTRADATSVLPEDDISILAASAGRGHFRKLRSRRLDRDHADEAKP